MKSIARNEINPIRMAINPPEVIINCGMKVINTDGYIYEYVGIGWIQCEIATINDHENIPQLF